MVGLSQRLADDRRDDRPGRLPRAERVEWPEDRDRQAERAEIALAQRIGADLGRGVWRLALKRVPLVDGDGLGGAVNLRCRGQDHPRQGRARPAGVENVGRAQHVGLNHVVRVVIRIRDRDQGPEVKDPLPALDGPADGAGVFQVAALDLDGVLNIGGQVAQIAAVVAAVIPDEAPGPGGHP